MALRMLVITLVIIKVNLSESFARFTFDPAHVYISFFAARVRIRDGCSLSSLSSLSLLCWSVIRGAHPEPELIWKLAVIDVRDFCFIISDDYQPIALSVGR